jgi:hypothetical protein
MVGECSDGGFGWTAQLRDEGGPLRGPPRTMTRNGEAIRSTRTWRKSGVFLRRTTTKRIMVHLARLGTREQDARAGCASRREQGYVIARAGSIGCASRRRRARAGLRELARAGASWRGQNLSKREQG